MCSYLGTKIVYDRNQLLFLRQSPLSKTPPINLVYIPGVTCCTTCNTTNPSQELPNGNVETTTNVRFVHLSSLSHLHTLSLSLLSLSHSLKLTHSHSFFRMSQNQRVVRRRRLTSNCFIWKNKTIHATPQRRQCVNTSLNSCLQQKTKLLHFSLL